ncbi:hypothetical protein BOX15_Mlig017575g3, partial [Macrostomum lignano]
LSRWLRLACFALRCLFKFAAKKKHSAQTVLGCRSSLVCVSSSLPLASMLISCSRNRSLPVALLALFLLGGGCVASSSSFSSWRDNQQQQEGVNPQLLARALAIAAGEVARDPALAAKKLRASAVELRARRGGDAFQELSPECGTVFSSLLSSILGLVGGNDLPESDQFLQWLDSIFKPEAGILLGNVRWIGSREECESIRLPVYQDSTNTSTLMLHTNGRYCMFGVKSRGNSTTDSGGRAFSGGDSLQTSLELALCLPNPCKGIDAEIAVNFVVEIVLNLLGPILQGVPGIGGIVDTIKSYKLVVKSCAQTNVEASNPLSSGALAVICLTGLLVFLILLATAVTAFVDSRYPEAQRDVYRDICRAFCLRSNLNKLFAPASGGSLGCINGIRVLSIFWVILGHTLLFIAPLLDNPLQLLNDFRKRWQAVIIINATTSVDSFFMLSGALVAYVFCRQVGIADKEKCRSTLRSWKFWALFYFHRYWRLTPVLMFFLFWHWSLTGYFGNGPFLSPDRTPVDVAGCPKSWWALMLYAQNFANVGDSIACLGHTWYLANDMQMYLLSPLLLLPFVFGGLIFGSVASVVVVAGSMVCTGVLNYQYGFRRGHLNFVPGETDGYDPEKTYYETIYIKPYCRMGAYAIGILLGYVLATRKTIRMPKLVALLCWAIAAAGGLALLYLVQGQIADTGPPLTLQQVTVYWSFLRPGFALCVAWVVFACVYGYGGPVNELLSWSWFTPLARLSYCAYIVHASVMFAFFYTYDSKFHLSDSMLIMIYLASIMLTFLVSLVLSMLVEAPLLGLEKALRAGGGSRQADGGTNRTPAPQPGKANDYYYSNGGYEGGPSSNRFEMRSVYYG